MLEFSHSEQPQHEVPGDLHLFLRAIAEEVEPLARRHANDFELYLATDVPQQVSADFRRLRTVLLNLLGNAAKFTRGGRIQLHVSCQPRGVAALSLQLQVEDTGPGIHPDDQQRLLQPFERGAGVEAVEGSGLGLAIVTQALQAMDSALRVESDGVSGSRFSFELNLALPGERAGALA